MLEWISSNSAVVNAITSLIMAGIWAVYLHLMYFSYRRQRRAMILINRTMGSGMEGHCLVSNMSAEPVYVLCVLAILQKRDGQEEIWSATDETLSSDRESTPGAHQGPLSSGDYIDIGSFNRLVRRGETENGGEVPYTSIEIVVVASYAASRRFVGASRRFKREDGQDTALRPTKLTTEQLSGFRHRHRLQNLLAQQI